MTNLEVCLYDENFHDLLKSNLLSTSKTTYSLLKLAAYHFAEKMRSYEIINKEDYLDKWEKDEEVTKVNKYLEKLGYSFKLNLINPNKNIYEIILTKKEKSFILSRQVLVKEKLSISYWVSSLSMSKMA